MADDWRWAAARAAGTSHIKAGAPCQDAWAIRRLDGPAGAVLVAIVADGAGSAIRSREGSRAVVRGLIAAAAQWFARHAELPDEAEVRRWLATLRGYLGAQLSEGGELRDFAATLVGAFVADDAALIVHVGDGACVIDDGAGGWAVGSWPENGDYANLTYFVTDATGPRLRVTLVPRRVSAVALFTDGLEDLALQRVERSALPGFFGPMLGPVRAATAGGFSASLARSLRGFLVSERVNALTDDDKTLVLAARAP